MQTLKNPRLTGWAGRKSSESSPLDTPKKNAIKLTEKRRPRGWPKSLDDGPIATVQPNVAHTRLMALGGGLEVWGMA